MATWRLATTLVERTSSVRQSRTEDVVIELTIPQLGRMLGHVQIDVFKCPAGQTLSNKPATLTHNMLHVMNQCSWLFGHCLARGEFENVELDMFCRAPTLR